MNHDYEKNVSKNIAQNRRAYYDYFIDEVYETGIVLTGTEVKSLRNGKCNIAAAHADEIGGEIFLLNSDIAEYAEAHRYNHYPKRPRKLLLHAKQIKKMLGTIRRKGFTLIPIALYFNKKNLVKLALGLARGKKSHDKRETIKDREWQRDKARLEV